MPPVPITRAKPNETSNTGVAWESRPRIVPVVAKLVVKTRLKSTSNTRATYTPRSRNQSTTAVPSNEVLVVAVLLLIVVTSILRRLRRFASSDHPHQVLLV